MASYTNFFTEPFYETLRAEDPLLAQAFLQINEYEQVDTIIPYRALREDLLKSEETKSLVRSFRATNENQPIYISFMDADIIALRTGLEGTFSHYDTAITNSPECLHGATTGYSISVDQNPYASLAVAFDMSIRQALATLSPLAPYYPEPNTAIRVLDNEETLEASFTTKPLGDFDKYGSPQEMPELLKNLIQKRFSGSRKKASPHFKFLPQGAIGTILPPRFLENRKKNDGTKNPKSFSGEFDSKVGRFVTLTFQDLANVRNTSQSHLKSLDWANYIYENLKELILKGSIQIIDKKQPGAIVKNQKRPFLKSIFSSIHKSYSPVAITIKNVKEKEYNVVAYLYSFVENFEKMTPAPLEITYGKHGISTRNTGNLLRRHISAAKNPHNEVYIIVDKFSR